MIRSALIISRGKSYPRMLRMVPASMSRFRGPSSRVGSSPKVNVDCSSPAPMDDIRRKAALSRCLLAWHPGDDETDKPPRIYQLNVPGSDGLGAMMHRRGCHLHRKEVRNQSPGRPSLWPSISLPALIECLFRSTPGGRVLWNKPTAGAPLSKP